MVLRKWKKEVHSCIAKKSLLEHLTEMANISQKSKYWMSVGKWMNKFGCSHVETSLKS